MPDWVTKVFSEEVVRGGPAFSLSLLLRHLDPILRKAAGMSGWQVISPARAVGQAAGRGRTAVRAAGTVHGSDHPGRRPRHRRGGNPARRHCGADARHAGPGVARRRAARNARVLFATCFDPELYQSLKDMHGKTLVLQATPAGEIEQHEASAAEKAGFHDYAACAVGRSAACAGAARCGWCCRPSSRPRLSAASRTT